MAERGTERTSLADLEFLDVLARALPAKNRDEIARRSDGRYRSGQAVRGREEALASHCGKEVIIEHEETGQLVLSDEGLNLYEYAKIILRTHREIRTWPPVHEIVIGATQRTASSYLPSLLARFFEKFVPAQEPFPVQITVRESDSQSVFFERLRNGETDLGLRGLPLAPDEHQGYPIPDDVQAVPFGPEFRLLAVSLKPLPKQIAMVDLLKAGRVGILKMNIPSVLSLLSKNGDHVFLPQQNVVICESYTVMMSFICRSICTGVIYVHPDVPAIPGLHFAELTDLVSTTRILVFGKRSLLDSLTRITCPEHRKNWKREHYLAKLREVFWDQESQNEALKPSFPAFPFM